MSQPPNTRSSSFASSMNLRISGERCSVRFPSRIAPIWVSEPMGRAIPRRTAITPARNVVETAPLSPTIRTPSFPFGFRIARFFRIEVSFCKFLRFLICPLYRIRKENLSRLGQTGDHIVSIRPKWRKGPALSLRPQRCTSESFCGNNITLVRIADNERSAGNDAELLHTERPDSRIGFPQADDGRVDKGCEIFVQFKFPAHRFEVSVKVRNDPKTEALRELLEERPRFPDNPRDVCVAGIQHFLQARVAFREAQAFELAGELRAKRFMQCRLAERSAIGKLLLYARVRRFEFLFSNTYAEAPVKFPEFLAPVDTVCVDRSPKIEEDRLHE